MQKHLALPVAPNLPLCRTYSLPCVLLHGQPSSNSLAEFTRGVLSSVSPGSPGAGHGNVFVCVLEGENPSARCQRRYSAWMDFTTARTPHPKKAEQRTHDCCNLLRTWRVQLSDVTILTVPRLRDATACSRCMCVTFVTIGVEIKNCISEKMRKEKKKKANFHHLKIKKNIKYDISLTCVCNIWNICRNAN